MKENYYYIFRRGTKKVTGHMVKAYSMYDAICFIIEHKVGEDIGGDYKSIGTHVKLDKDKKGDAELIERRLKGIGGKVWDATFESAPISTTTN